MKRRLRSKTSLLDQLSQVVCEVIVRIQQEHLGLIKDNFPVSIDGVVLTACSLPLEGRWKCDAHYTIVNEMIADFNKPYTKKENL